MTKNQGKWWLAVIVMCCLAPSAFAGRDHGCDPHSRGRDRCQQVPEGGSAAIFLLGGGLTAVGAMFIKSRMAKPTQS